MKAEPLAEEGGVSTDCFAASIRETYSNSSLLVEVLIPWEVFLVGTLVVVVFALAVITERDLPIKEVEVEEVEEGLGLGLGLRGGRGLRVWLLGKKRRGREELEEGGAAAAIEVREREVEEEEVEEFW